MTSTTVTPVPDEPQPSKRIAAELRGFAALLADEPADADGMVRVGSQNLADLLTTLHRAADRLDGTTHERIVESVTGPRVDRLTPAEREHLALVAEVAARVFLERLDADKPCLSCGTSRAEHGIATHAFVEEE